MEANLSLAEENYLKAVFALSKDGQASTNAIADYMDTKASSVTDMLKKLDHKSLVNYVPYQGATLTKKGEETAVYIIRKHRLWEVFLVNKLNFGWDEVHEIAEQLEHIKSPELINRLDKFLEYPKTDPHGDPIPDKNGVMPKFKLIPLSSVQPGISVVITGVEDSSTEFLQYLDKQSLQLGKKLRIVERIQYDNSTIIEMDNQTITLSQKICENLLVKA